MTGAAAAAASVSGVAEVIAPDVIKPAVVLNPVVLSDSTATLVHYLTWPVVTLVLVMVVAALLVWNAQHSKNKVDFKDLILDFDVNRVSLSKFSNLVALCITSWAMIALVVGGVMTETYLAAYMVAWSGNALGFQYLKMRSAQTVSPD